MESTGFKVSRILVVVLAAFYIGYSLFNLGRMGNANLLWRSPEWSIIMSILLIIVFSMGITGAVKKSYQLTVIYTVLMGILYLASAIMLISSGNFQFFLIMKLYFWTAVIFCHYLGKERVADDRLPIAHVTYNTPNVVYLTNEKS